jgi:hypothetical protein
VRAETLAQLGELTQGRVDARDVPSLLPLYGVLAPEAAPVTVGEAQRASERFADYYTHAVPFSRSALAELWRRCETSAGQQAACRAGRAEAERRLGPLEVRIAAPER